MAKRYPTLKSYWGIVRYVFTDGTSYDHFVLEQPTRKDVLKHLQEQRCGRIRELTEVASIATYPKKKSRFLKKIRLSREPARCYEPPL